jgi:hypothetical protein
MSRLGITNYFVNTVVTALQASEWEMLLQRFEALDLLISSASQICFG